MTVEDCEEFRDALDEEIASGAISGKTATNVWTIWTTAMKAASGTWKKDKPKRFKVRDDDPCKGVAPPDYDPDDAKDLQWLYPCEFAQLIACEAVPVEWKIRYIFAVDLYSRGGELAALTWDDVNAFGVVSVRKTYNQQKKAIKGTKMGNSGNKRIALGGDRLALIQAMRETRGDSAKVIPMPARKYWAASLRDHLQLAGVTRSELFADPKDKTQKRIRFHDLRSTGLTWLAIQGVDAHKIKQRAGHKNLEQTEAYIRAAEEAGKDIGEPFPALPPGLIDHVKRSRAGQLSETIVEAPGIEPDQALAPFSRKIAVPASTQLDFDFVEPSSFHPDPRFGARSGNIRAT